jgi:hypothetical protein
MRLSIQLTAGEVGSGETKQIAVHLKGGEVVKFGADPDEWFDAFDRAHRKRRGIEIKDLNHGGRLGINPQNVLYWKTLRPSPDDD